MDTFLCDHCNQWKEITDFYPYAKRKCKACFKAYRQKWEKLNPDKVAAKSKRRKEKHRERYLAQARLKHKPQGYKRHPRFREYLEKWRREHREEWNVKARVRYAVLAGRLIRPSECSKCHYQCKPQAHHEDYSKPYDVIWLCASCHRLRHNQLKLKSDDS